MRDRWERLNGPARIAGVDLARGLAVIGMFAAHLLLTADAFVWGDPSTWSTLVNGRSSILFAVLAGVSIGIVTGGTRPLTGPVMITARLRLVLRGCALWVLGILLALTGVPVYVILPAYAILFLLALPFTALHARTVLVTAAGIAITMPFVQPLLEAPPLWEGPFGAEAQAFLGWNYPFTVWAAFVLAGLGLARSGLSDPATQLRMLAGGAAVSALGSLLGEVRSPGGAYLDAVLSVEPHSAGLPEVIGSGGFAVAVLGACLLLCRLRPVVLITLPVRAMGAMPLTAYTLQLVIWAVASLLVLGTTSDLFGFVALEPFWPLTIGMMIGCTAWALLVGRGPLEWALARLGRVISDPPASRLEA